MTTARKNPRLELLTVSAAAREAGMSVWLFKKVVESGQVSCLSIAGRRRIDRCAVQQFVQKNRAQSVGAASA
jgi:hypothetical protein